MGPDSPRFWSTGSGHGPVDPLTNVPNDLAEGDAWPCSSAQALPETGGNRCEKSGTAGGKRSFRKTRRLDRRLVHQRPDVLRCKGQPIGPAPDGTSYRAEYRPTDHGHGPFAHGLRSVRTGPSSRSTRIVSMRPARSLISGTRYSMRFALAICEPSCTICSNSAIRRPRDHASTSWREDHGQIPNPPGRAWMFDDLVDIADSNVLHCVEHLFERDFHLGSGHVDTDTSV